MEAKSLCRINTSLLHQFHKTHPTGPCQARATAKLFLLQQGATLSRAAQAIVSMLMRAFNSPMQPFGYPQSPRLMSGFTSSGTRRPHPQLTGCSCSLWRLCIAISLAPMPSAGPYVQAHVVTVFVLLPSYGIVEPSMPLLQFGSLLPALVPHYICWHLMPDHQLLGTAPAWEYNATRSRHSASHCQLLYDYQLVFFIVPTASCRCSAPASWSSSRSSSRQPSCAN